MAKKKLDSKAFAQKKRARRQWITFVRMVRYGINNFSRNAWLTVAATAVMTITLLIMFVTFAARSILQETVAMTRDKVDMSIYLKTETSDEDGRAIVESVRKLSSVKRADYISAEEARENFASNNVADKSALQAINEATNRFPATVRVNLYDINNTAQLKNFVDSNQTVQKNLNPNQPPSYQGSRKDAISTIAGWTDMAQKVGTVASVIFIAISSLIIFNTIRMAIFNRRDEIQMMKLIGADRNFIRGPFVVEAVVYGFIAALVATAIGLGLLYAIEPRLSAAGVAISSTVNSLTMYVSVVLLVMILAGAVIGVISSLLATRRYLKI